MLLKQFALAAQEGLSSTDRAMTAGIVTLQGVLSVFAILAILFGATILMHRLIHGKPKKTTENRKASPTPEQATNSNAPAPNAQDAAVAAAIAAALAAQEDGGATVAAITAAIIAARAEEGNTGAFRVVAFKRVQTVKRR